MTTPKIEETPKEAPPEPITMGKGDMHCSPDCSYLTLQPRRYLGTCARDGKKLDFYDWYLAHCKGQYDELAVASQAPDASVQD